MSAIKYLTRKVASAEAECEEAEKASKEARDRAWAAYDRVSAARRELAKHVEGRVQKVKESL
jgi:predicted site-specific integrase-resolvase